MKTRTLPDKPSELIRLAIKDLTTIERNKNYNVNMSVWRRWNSSDKIKCEVCLAGSVMSKTLRATTETNPFAYTLDISQKLLVIDYLRSGSVILGCDVLNRTTSLEKRWIESYHKKRNKAKFKRDMLALADELEAEGN